MSQNAQSTVVIEHEVGLHARPSVKLTQLAKRFAAKIEIATSPEGPWIDAKSIVKVMGSKTPRGALLHVRAEGDDAESAVESIVALVRRDFELAT